MNIPKELLRKIYEIEIIAKRDVMELFPGVHESVFLGGGYNFVRHKEYEPGDNVMDIDQHLFAHSPEKAYVTLCTKLKHMNIWIFADVSSSGRFGFGDLTKRELLVKSAAFLGFSASVVLDNIGLIAFTNKVKRHLVPKSGKSWVYYMLREIWRLSNDSGKTDIAASLKRAKNFLGESDMIVLISDFLDNNCFKRDSPFWQGIRTIAGRHDLIPVVLEEDDSFLMSAKGHITLRDLETGKNMKFYSSPKSCEEFKKELDKRHEILRSWFMELNARAVFLMREANLRKFHKFFLIRKRSKLR